MKKKTNLFTPYLPIEDIRLIVDGIFSVLSASECLRDTV